MGKLYAAYGSNMNLQQMAVRCPSARVVGTGYIKGRQLEFSGVATITPKQGGCVPVLVWDITQRDEFNLDRYEGFPHMYRKEAVNAWMKNGGKLECMVYVMNNSRVAPPNLQYFNCILQGYRSNGIPEQPLLDALKRSQGMSSYK